MKEIWKDIDGYEGLYKVSNLGRVKSVHRIVTKSNGKPMTVYERILRDTASGHGYRSIALSKNGAVLTKTVHKLVASAFLHKSDNCTDVNHIEHKL